MMWKRQVEKHINQIGLKREDAIDKVKWRNGCLRTVEKHEVNRATKVNAEKTGLKKNWISLSLFLSL